MICQYLSSKFYQFFHCCKCYCLYYINLFFQDIEQHLKQLADKIKTEEQKMDGMDDGDSDMEFGKLNQMRTSSNWL